jgi:hypothetical protein
MPVLAGLGAVATVYGGISGMIASNQEAALQRQQGQTAIQEAEINAKNEAWNQTQAVQNQRLAFLANGISLNGSPALVLAKSKEYGQSQVDAILAQGTARAKLAYGEAAITENKGRAALIGALASGAGKAYQSGLFDSSASTKDANATSMDGSK